MFLKRIKMAVAALTICALGLGTAGLVAHGMWAAKPAAAASVPVPPEGAGPDRPIKPVLLHSLAAKASGMVPVAFAPDGKLLATGEGPDVRLWDPVAGKALRVLTAKEQQQRINSLAFSSDGQTLAAASDSKTIVLWDPTKGEVRRQLDTTDSAIDSVAFSPDGKQLLTGGRTGGVQLWDIASGKVVRPFGEQKGWVMSVAIAPDGKLAASSGQGENVRLWEVSTGKMIRQLESKPAGVDVVPIGAVTRPMSAVRCVAFSPDGTTLAADNNDGSIWLWDVAAGKKLKEIGKHGPPFWPSMGIRALAFTPNGKALAAAGGLRTFQIWETATGKELTQVAGTADTERYFGTGPQVLWVALTANGRQLASGCTDGTIRVWSLADSK